jgi:signal transduction histidine kinase/ActR/RegA family two-component response regulator
MPRPDLHARALPLLAGFALLTAIVVVAAWFVQMQKAENAAVSQHLMTQNRLTRVFSLLQDAEIGQRGYLLTGDPTYLEPYEGSLAALPAELDAVEALLRPPGRHDVDLDRLQALADQRLAVIAASVQRKQAGDSAGAVNVLREGTGKAIMDEIRQIMARIQAAEERRLLDRQAAAAQSGSLLQIGTLLAVALVLGLAALVLIDLRRRTATIARQRDELQAANAQLVGEMTRREAAEARIQQMQKLEAVGQLTGGVAHDFNNMLAVVISSLNLIQRRLGRGDTNVGRFADAAMEAAGRAANLTHRLLAFSRQQPLAPEAIDANRFVAGMSDLLRRTLGENVRMETVLAGGLWRTHADPSQLENAILNLCVNARDAMPDGGRLTIETANCHLDDSYARQHADVPSGQYVLIAVSDGGIGMTPEVIGKAFDPFFTTKPVGRGTGLGLSQVYGFVKQSGGHVKIYSEPGQGTTVKIYLPRFFGEAEVHAPRPAPALPAGDVREVVLVVEDEERVRQISVDILRELGYTVIHADGAAAALRQLDAHPQITLLFTDIVMPDMNGRKLADEATRRRPDLKVLFTTGFTRNAVVHNGVLDPGVNFLPKPFTLEQLAAKVREVLGPARPADSASA